MKRPSTTRTAISKSRSFHLTSAISTQQKTKNTTSTITTRDRKKSAMRRSNSANNNIAHLPILKSYSDLQHQLLHHNNKSRHDRHWGVFAALSDDSDNGSSSDHDDSDDSSCREQPYRIDPKGHHHNAATAYLWKKRKEGLAHHPLSHNPALLSAAAAAAAMEANCFAKRYSLRAIVTWLLLLCACYALSSLTTTPSKVVIQQQQRYYRYPKATVTTYYLNIREPPKGNPPLEPVSILQSMVRAHAYAFEKGGQFGGVCGYPTLNPHAQKAQRDAIHILQQWGLSRELPFDVCPPLEAVLNRDDEHFVLMEASKLLLEQPQQTMGREAHKEWRMWMESKRNQPQQQHQHQHQHTTLTHPYPETSSKQSSTANDDIEVLWQTLLSLDHIRSEDEPEKHPSGLVATTTTRYHE